MLGFFEFLLLSLTLQFLNIGQPIQEEVVFHDHKKGTPTMGGVFIILGTYAGYVLSHINFWTIGQGFKIELISINTVILNLLLFGTLMASVGLIDDLLKVRKNRNLGLRARNKIFLQILVGSFVSLYFYNLDYSSTFYFFSGFGFEVGFLKWILIVFLIVGITFFVILSIKAFAKVSLSNLGSENFEYKVSNSFLLFFCNFPLCMKFNVVS